MPSFEFSRCGVAHRGEWDNREGGALEGIVVNVREISTMEKGSITEQRRNRRFRGMDGALAAFSVQETRSFTSLGEIIDISESGLSLRYVASGSGESRTPPHLDIFGYRGPHIHIVGIPCKVVYESELETLDESTSTRRCGIQFGELTPIQKFQLEHFIQSYTTPETFSREDAH
jgi:c-di-GMP-binding flagellar brake protein YcgR